MLAHGSHHLPPWLIFDVREKQISAKTKIFIVIWLVAVVSLFCFPGFEARALTSGLIIGFWPFMLLGQSIYNIHPLALYAAVFVACGLIVGLCAWVMEKADVTRRIWRLLTVAIIAGSCVGFLDGISFDEWKRFPTIEQATEHSGVEPARWEFARSIQIPNILVGGLQGFYLASAIGLLWSLALMTRKRSQRPLI